MGQFWANISLIFIDFSWIYYQFSVIFSQNWVRGYSGISMRFHWKIGDFIMTLFWIFTWNFIQFSLIFHWFSLKIGQFYYQIWLFQPKSIIFIFVPLFGWKLANYNQFSLKFWPSTPNPLFQMWSTFCWILVNNWSWIG